MFKLGDDESINRHKGDRKVKYGEADENKDESQSPAEELEEIAEVEEEEDIEGVEKLQLEEDKEAKVDNVASVVQKEDVDDTFNGEMAGNDHASDGNREEGDSDDESDDGGSQFPDTKLEMNFSSAKEGKVVEFKTAVPAVEEATFVQEQNKNINSAVTSKLHSGSRGQPQWKIDEQTAKEDNRQKRGKKGKLKKMKEKYKDQDEEEKAMRMQILQESQKNKEESKKFKKKQDKIAAEEKKKRNQEFVKEKMQRNREKAAAKEALKKSKEEAGETFIDEDDEGSGDEDQKGGTGDLVNVLDSITGESVVEI